MIEVKGLTKRFIDKNGTVRQVFPMTIRPPSRHYPSSI